MDGPRGPLRGPGSKGSEGSACLWQAGSKGGGIALWAMSIKSALRDLAFCVIWHDKHYVDQPPPVAFPPPLVAPATKGGDLPRPPGQLACFPTPAGRLYGFRRQRRYKKWSRRRRTSPAQRYYITPEGGVLNPPVRRQPITGRTLGAQGQRPGGAINPRPRKRASTFGNTASRRHRIAVSR